MDSIQEQVNKRNIKILLHFTRLDHLESILINGIVPVPELKKRTIPVTVNDGLRLDGFENASCLTISFPNYKMFYALRMKDPGVAWCVIALKPEILWTHDCAFCKDNAASIDISTTDINTRKGPEAFSVLFDDFPIPRTRKALALPDRYPTCPQAEVLVFGTIKPSYIHGAYVQSNALAELWKSKFKNFSFSYLPKAFSYRQDYQSW